LRAKREDLSGMIDDVEKQILIKPENRSGVSPDIASYPFKLFHACKVDAFNSM